MSWLSSTALLRPGETGRLARWLQRGIRRRVAAEPPAQRHPFDVLHGVDTAGLMYAADLPTGYASDRHSEGYYATAPSLFQGASSCWLGTLANGLAPEDYAFADLGCGKGRVLMLASEFPFRFVRGIELNPALARAAQRNLRRWLRRPRACQTIGVECGDVPDRVSGLFAQDGPVILFLFNSFGAEILAPLMEKLAAAARERTAPIDLVYVHPEHEVLVSRTPGIEVAGWAEVPFSEEDAAADVFGVGSDRVAVYRLAGGMCDGSRCK